MKKINFRIIVSFLLASLFVTNTFTQSQSMYPLLSGIRGVVTGTPGEVRRTEGDINNTTNLRLHGGVDLVPPNGTSNSIYSVTGGIVMYNPAANGVNNAANAWGAVIAICDYQYKHVKLDPALRRNPTTGAYATITPNGYIGELFNPTNFPVHVHMMGVNETLNYQLLLNPYSDTEEPTFWDYEHNCWVGAAGCSSPDYEVEVLSFFTNGIDNDHEPNVNNNGLLRKYGDNNMPEDVSLEFDNTGDIEHTVIFDRVDFMARVRDDRVNADGTGGGHNCAPTRIGYEIFDITEQSVFNNQNAVDFRTLIITRIHRNDPMDGNTTPTMIANCPPECEV